MIVFLDESGFSQRPAIRRTWGRRGQPPVVREHVTWKRFSAVGAIGYHPGRQQVRLFLSLRLQAIRGEEIVGFLRSLRRHVHDPVILVWDNLSVHRSQTVQGYLHAQQARVQVEWLPTYAPELNPVEDVWANLDGRELANFVPEDMDQLRRQVTKGTRRLRRRNHLIWGFLKHAKLIKDEEIP